MIRLKRIDFMCKRKLLIVFLLAFFLSMFVATHVSAVMYWKDYNGPLLEGGYMPDIAQQQDFDNDGDVDLHYCAPVAEANSLWWLDRDHSLGIFELRDIQESNSTICPGWTEYVAGSASGGSIMYSDTTDAICTFPFTGTSIGYIGTPSSNKGIASVQVDALPAVDVDLYSPTLQWQQLLHKWTGLSPGTHTITITVTGRHNLLSTPLIDVDAFLVDGYIGGDVNGDGKNDTLDLVQELAIMMKTNQGACSNNSTITCTSNSDCVPGTCILRTGTLVEDEQAGINAFLRKYDPEFLLAKSLYEHTEYDPEFDYIKQEVERSQDVKLDLGFWRVEKILRPNVDDDGDSKIDEDPIDGIDNDKDGKIDEDPPTYGVIWKRLGGHAVTVAGVGTRKACSISGIDCTVNENCLPDGGICNLTPNVLAISDPYYDAAEGGAAGVVRSAPPPPHSPLPHPADSTLHNNGGNASHDRYDVVPSLSPGGKLALVNYPLLPFPSDFEYNNGPMPAPVVVENFKQVSPPVQLNSIFTEIEAAVIVSQTPPIIQTPPAGTAVTSGSWYAISWTWTSPKMVKFDLHYSLNDGTDWKPVRGGRTIVKNTEIVDAIGIPGDGGAEVYYWKVPVPANNKIKSLVKVTGYDASGVKFAEDISDRFTIEVVKVTDPDGGGSWKVGSQKYVTWRTNKTTKPVTSTKVYVTRNANVSPTWTLLNTLTGNPGSMNWTVTGPASNYCKVKVELKNNGTTVGSDISDKVFSIVP